MNFSRFLDIQSWWEVPSIAYFCSLFRTAFNLLDFDIEELEEALLTDGTEDSGSSLLTELIVRLLNGCLGNNDISAFNYQMYLRRLFRQKCQESGRYNPFNTDIDFQFLPLRRKVEILYALCDFRLDAEDVFDLFKNLEAESLRVEPLGWDDNDSAYWYFYGTRLYREDIIKKPKGKKKKKNKDKKRGWLHGEDWNDDETERVWQVVCFTEEDWTHLTQKFCKANSKVEKELFRSLSQNFMPEIPRLFQEKERLQRKRLLELAPRRTSSRVLQKIRQKEEEESSKATTDVETSKDSDSKESQDLARRNRAKRRNLLRSKSVSSSSSDASDSSDSSEPEEMPQKNAKTKNKGKKSKNSAATHKGEPPPDPPIRTGRKTNNSLASATGQILIPDNDEPVNSTRRKVKTSQIFSQTDEDIQIDMYKVLEQLTNHEDAWPFLDPVEEEYAPNYYTVIRRPMDLHKMEERLDSGYYADFSTFKADFKLIVNNCRLYNGQDNEYTAMVDNLQAAFDRLTEKYIYRVSSSDEEIAVEYQLPTPSRRQKRKASDSPARQAPGKRKKRKSHSDESEAKSSTSNIKKEKPDDDEPENGDTDKDIDESDAANTADKGKDNKDKKPDDEDEEEEDTKKSKEDHKDKDKDKDKEKEKDKEKGKKKRKGHHHRHGKHSKNHKKNKQHGSKSKHSKKQKHGKNKDKEGKKSRQKKKKSKHHDPEPEPPEVLKRSESQESLSSSNRSRSASPLPSIHTPSPSPTELDKPETSKADNFDKIDYDQPATSKHHAECEFLKDKYDKIKERRRHAAKDVWESLFDYKQKSDKLKQNLNIPEKEKNQKLRETIEKLKAKNEKYKDTSLFASLFTPRSTRRVEKKKDYKEEDSDEDCSDDEPLESVKGKCTNKKLVKKSSAKNESASEALEEAVKDISKWLDDAPKGSTVSSPCDSPAPTVSTEEQDSSSRQDDELSQGERSLASRKEASRKRPSSREPKLMKRREIQRTIDRLQPGKSKGNLLTNLANKPTADKTEDGDATGQASEPKDEEPSPKLSLGSVLPTVNFTLGDDHNFGKDDEEKEQKTATKATETEGDTKIPEIVVEKEPEEKPVVSSKKDAEVETELPFVMKPSQEKATPNLSAWFKAFGAPKTTAPTTTTKKKAEETENEEKPQETNEVKSSPRVGAVKFDSPNDPNSPNPDGGDSPHPSMSATPRQRRTSTGSSISERSSFSQDLDSPRHQMSHTSPLLRSPASPRNDDFQKITYPIINGTVRAGFYQDTTSLKSSPEKSCSPREGPQSPYSPYPQHVYASSSTAPGSATPNYFVDHNKSPLPTYTQNAPPYYDSTKATALNKPPRPNEDYTSVAPETYPNHFNSPYSPSSQYSPVQTNYSQPQLSPQTPPNAQQMQNAHIQEQKPSLFPVKKRTYNEPEQTQPEKVVVNKEPVEPQKNDYPKPQVTNMATAPSVDDIALALSERNQVSKLNNTRDMRPPEYTAHTDRQQYDMRKPVYENNEPAHANKRDMNNVDLTKPLGMSKKDGVDMVNMGYFNSEDRRNSTDTREMDYLRDAKVTQAHKGYEIEAIAINLGINSQQLPKPLTKPNITSCNMTPAHSHERQHPDMSINQNIAHAHQNQYDLTSGQSISNFSLNDFELANKKLYANNIASSTALDYGNWKNPNQMRKDILPSDYSSAYAVNNEEKNKAEAAAALNYKNLQHQQYNNYANMPRLSNQRPQELSQSIPSELRIPNPRGMHKPDNTNVTSIADDAIAKNIEAISKAQKAEKLVQNLPLVSSIPYKTPYSTHSTLPIDTLRNLPNIPQMLERYSNDERYLSSFATTTSSLYHDKTFQMAQMFNKGLVSDVNTTVSHSNIYSQPAVSMSKDNNIYKNTTTPANTQIEAKTKPKRKRTTDTKQTLPTAQTYQHPTSCGNDVLTSVKTSIMPTTAFNFGASTNMALSGMYGENAGFSIDDFRNSTSQLMAANYMAAAVAHQQRNNEASAEKLVKPAHQNANHSASSFPFIAHSQVRAGYPFVGSETSSPLYQQYIQRYQEELQRQTGAQIMGLYPPVPTYPPPLGVRQPYDSINRPSWI